MSIFNNLEDEKMAKNKIEVDDIREDFDLDESSKSVNAMLVQLTAINEVLQKNKDKLEAFLKLKELDVQKMKDTVKIYDNGTAYYVDIHNKLKADLDTIQKNINDHKVVIAQQLKRMQQADISINRRKIVEFNIITESFEKMKKLKKEIYIAVTIGVFVMLFCTATILFFNDIYQNIT